MIEQHSTVLCNDYSLCKDVLAPAEKRMFQATRPCPTIGNMPARQNRKNRPEPHSTIPTIMRGCRIPDG